MPNFSFEDTIICPKFGLLENTKYWFQPNNPSLFPSGSTDYYHECSVDFGVPTNWWGGFQYAIHGKAYIGIATYVDPNYFAQAFKYREYIEVKLTEPLKKDSIYCVSFYINLLNSARYATSNIGVYFSKDSCLSFFDWFYLLPNKPQLRNDYNNIITDTLNWILLSWKYKAEGEENYMTIGNFDSSQFTNFISLNTPIPPNDPGPAAYYLIDNVGVFHCTDDFPTVTDTFYLHIPNIFTPNADGQNDAWQVRARGVQQLSAAVYNRWGALLWQQSVEDTAQTEIKTAWNGYTSTGLPVSAGTYYYLVSYTSKEGEIKKEKGFLTLVR